MLLLLLLLFLSLLSLLFLIFRVRCASSWSARDNFPREKAPPPGTPVEPQASRTSKFGGLRSKRRPPP